MAAEAAEAAKSVVAAASGQAKLNVLMVCDYHVLLCAAS